MKRLQNRIAESGLLLPVMAVYGLGVWLLGGLLTRQWWPQLACFVLSAYLMVELTNVNALLRVRSRMVSATFIALSCTMCFLFGSLTGGLLQLFVIASLLLLLSTYQMPQALERVFYAFVLIGLASIFFVQILFFVPLLWLLMATQLQALSWRTWLASVLGILTPYWFLMLWFLYQQDFSPLVAHVATLTHIQVPHFTFQAGPVMAFAFTLVLAAAGIVHFWQYSFEDKIRIRLLFGFFTAMTVFTLFLAIVQPQHFGVLLRLSFVVVSPLVAHLFTFTSSRLSNMLFFAALAVALAITVFNLISC